MTLATVTAAEFASFDADRARHMMGDLAREMQIRFLPDTDLTAFIIEAHGRDFHNACEGGKFEVNDWAYTQWELDIAYREVDDRADREARARWLAPTTTPLTYTLAERMGA